MLEKCSTYNRHAELWIQWIPYSYHPQNLLSLFHSLSPWRIMTILKVSPVPLIVSLKLTSDELQHTGLLQIDGRRLDLSCPLSSGSVLCQSHNKLTSTLTSRTLFYGFYKKHWIDWNEKWNGKRFKYSGWNGYKSSNWYSLASLVLSFDQFNL